MIIHTQLHENQSDTHTLAFVHCADLLLRNGVRGGRQTQRSRRVDDLCAA